VVKTIDDAWVTRHNKSMAGEA